MQVLGLMSTMLMLRSGLCCANVGQNACAFVSSGVCLHNSFQPCFRWPKSKFASKNLEQSGTRLMASSSGGRGAKGITLDRMLQQQGFGTRKLCKTLITQGSVTIKGRTAVDPTEVIVPEDGMSYTVDEEVWEYRQPAYVMLNKPKGYECSQKPGAHPSVMDLLPDPFRERGVQSVGRLDVDTTGLLLLTDDGKFLHQITSPKQGKTKVYHVTCKHAVDDGQLERMQRGVELADEPGVIVRPTRVDLLSDTLMSLTITEGKYHQIKRMVAAMGNRCEGLRRVSIAGLELPPDLEMGDWRYLSAQEVEALRVK